MKNIQRMQVRIEELPRKKIIGIKQTMSFADYKIAELWRKFSPRLKEITNKVSSDLISMVIYKSSHFIPFKLTNEFEKWAAVEVSNTEKIPNGMESYILEGGLYAVFNYKGSSTDNSIFHYILETWLPNSEYRLDDRPHFEVLGEKYKNNDPNSEEEIWIPIKTEKHV